MREIKKLVMATNNRHKLREARAIAGDRLEILSLDDIGYHHDIPETADTLDGNALIKVRAIKEATGLDCFADDTGLMVDALGGAPGVYTARYAGEGCTPDDNIDKMLREMKDADDRHATFRTTIALSLDGEEHLFHGEVDGSIARRRSGSEGFGYDPIFISSETGKCFAEMTEEEKNRISHRGRAVSAMMKWLFALCLCIFAIIPSSASVSAGWTVFPTFDENILSVFDTPSKTYFLTQAQIQVPKTGDFDDLYCFLFTLEKDSGEVRDYGAHNYLSSSLIRLAQYNAAKNYLLLVYDDFGIDLLHDDGSVYYIPALKSASLTSTKNVRSISFDPSHDRAYLATDFGYIAIDDKKNEVASSGIYGTPIDYMVRVGDKLAILRDGAIYADAADANHISIDNFKPVAGWAEGNPIKLISLADDKCILVEASSEPNMHYVLTFTPGNPTPERKYVGSGYKDTSSQVRDGVLLEFKDQLALVSYGSGEWSLTRVPDEEYTARRGSWDMKEVFVAIPRKGFGSIRADGNGGWSVTRQVTRPNVPAPFRSNQLAYVPGYGMMVNSHGLDHNFSCNTVTHPMLLSAYKGGDWTLYGLPYLTPETPDRIINPCGFAQDPDQPDVFYIGSFNNGLLRINLKDPSQVLHMTREDDSPSLPGHVTAHPLRKSWKNVSPIESPVFDRNGNMVLAHMNTERKVKDDRVAEIWMWTPEDRKASVSPETFVPFTVIDIKETLAEKGMKVLPLMKSSAPGIIIYMALGKYGTPTVVYDHRGTVKDTSDDRMVYIRNMVDQDGNSVVAKYLHCAIEDPATGLVWVGTENGVFTFNPETIFDDPSRVSRIKVSRNDGTSLADYLLNGIGVNDISIDGDGRKWFSIAGGGIVVTSADGKSIIKEITNENSMLPSDIVYATCFNPESASMMIATSGGLCEYRMSGGPTSSSSSVRCYPNPVRPDYYGWVTIDGLEDNSLVKIADSAGNIIRELGLASGGSVRWDVCGSGLDRVASGVYFVLASSGSAGGNFSEVSKILVVN